MKIDELKYQLEVGMMENRKLEADMNNLASKVLQVPLALSLLGVTDVPDLLPSFIPISPMIIC